MHVFLLATSGHDCHRAGYHQNRPLKFHEDPPIAAKNADSRHSLSSADILANMVKFLP
jgi:hypothetical protein